MINPHANIDIFIYIYIRSSYFQLQKDLERKQLTVLGITDLSLSLSSYFLLNILKYIISYNIQSSNFVFQA